MENGKIDCEACMPLLHAKTSERALYFFIIYGNSIFIVLHYKLHYDY